MLFRRGGTHCRTVRNAHTNTYRCRDRDANTDIETGNTDSRCDRDAVEPRTSKYTDVGASHFDAYTGSDRDSATTNAYTSAYAGAFTDTAADGYSHADTSLSHGDADLADRDA